MQKCAKWRGMSEEECYKTWNGGQGMIVVIDEKDEKKFVSAAHKFGIVAKKCGRITRRKNPRLIIESKFGSGKTLVYKS